MRKRFEVVDNAIAEKLLGVTGYLREFGWTLIEHNDDGTVREVGSDGGEPEDQLLTRDWDWVERELNRVYDRANWLRFADAWVAIGLAATLHSTIAGARMPRGRAKPSSEMREWVIDLSLRDCRKLFGIPAAEAK